MEVPAWVHIGTLIIGFGTFFGIFVVGIVSAVVTIHQGHQSRIHERKLGVLKVLLESAYKEYEYRATRDMAKATAENKTPVILSFTEYILFYYRIAETITEKNVTEQDIKNALIKNKELIDAYYKHKKEHLPDYPEGRK